MKTDKKKTWPGTHAGRQVRRRACLRGVAACVAVGVAVAVGGDRAAAAPPPDAAVSAPASTRPGAEVGPWVKVPAGEFTMGAVPGDPHARRDEFPAHRVRIGGFWMQQTEVTNDQFARFVEATGYKTVAERPVDWEQLKQQVPPGTPKPPPEMLAPGALVFTPPPPGRDAGWHQWWSWTPNADWRHPLGPGSSIEGKGQHPAVQIAWEDARAYAAWAGGRLPTEAEWEWAARGGLDAKPFTWGGEPIDAGEAKANTWQGAFPRENIGRDGHLGTAPVAAYAPNGYGLHDMAGNVWEWTADLYRPDTYAARAADGVAVNPAGPATSFDPDEPTVPKYVTRGGSFLCHDSYCASYRPSARMKSSPDTGLNHTGFRLARDAAPDAAQ